MFKLETTKMFYQYILLFISFVYDVFKHVSSSFSIIFVLGSKDYTTIHIYHPSISIDTDICYNHVACKDRCLGPKNILEMN